MSTSAFYTKHASIFSKTKWGKLPVRPTNMIIENRDNFITEHSIKAALVVPEALISKTPFAGDVECYSVKDGGRVIVVSLLQWRTDMILPLQRQYEFVQVEPLFSAGHITLIRKFKSRLEYDTFVKSVKARKK